MTVRETIDFFARCQGARHRAEILMEVIKREKLVGISPDPDADAYMKGLNLVLVSKNLGIRFQCLAGKLLFSVFDCRENKQLLKQLSSPSVQRISIFLTVCLKMIGSSSTHASGNRTYLY
ncbi:hypothetical protein WN944_025243 [Citrus x changshan-huyou]|uniref:Uncharacterized protein n=1 Tax=Citrus x changshan-huyou TaxID=2935761 RepID=A0AAP0LQ70_9ROSI